MNKIINVEFSSGTQDLGIHYDTSDKFITIRIFDNEEKKSVPFTLKGYSELTALIHELELIKEAFRRVDDESDDDDIYDECVY